MASSGLRPSRLSQGERPPVKLTILDYQSGAHSSARLERIPDKDEVRGSSPRGPTAKQPSSSSTTRTALLPSALRFTDRNLSSSRSVEVGVSRAATSSSGHVVSVNVGTPRHLDYAGREVITAIWKSPVPGRTSVRGVNLDGDDQGDRRVHGGPDKAVYAYAEEDYQWWTQKLDVVPEPGTFGENITTRGIDLSGAVVGQRWELTDLVLEVTQPRLPCFKLGIRMGDVDFPDVFKRAARFGTYLRIIAEGTIGAGDEIRPGPTPSHGLTISDIGKGYPNPSSELIESMLGVEELPHEWQSWARRSRQRVGRSDALT